jgi:putative ABC transport system ATP-binding protein
VEVLQGLNRNEGLTLIMVTHNQELARHANRIFEMKDGQIGQIT